MTILENRAVDIDRHRTGLTTKKRVIRPNARVHLRAVVVAGGKPTTVK
jgi:hypothetical protein